MWPHLLYTIQQTLLGGAIGTAAGVMLALAMARWRGFFYFMDVPVGVLRTIPPLAAIPFMVLWLGPSQSAQLGVVVFYVGLMVTINAITAIRNLDPLVANFAKTLGADDRRIYRTVILPSILPELAGRDPRCDRRRLGNRNRQRACRRAEGDGPSLPEADRIPGTRHHYHRNNLDNDRVSRGGLCDYVDIQALHEMGSAK